MWESFLPGSVSPALIMVLPKTSHSSLLQKKCWKHLRVLGCLLSPRKISDSFNLMTKQNPSESMKMPRDCGRGDCEELLNLNKMMKESQYSLFEKKKTLIETCSEIGNIKLVLSLFNVLYTSYNMQDITEVYEKFKIIFHFFCF